MRRAFVVASAAGALVLCGMRAGAQAWRENAAHIGTTARVLLVGTRPDDEDNALIAWLSLGRHVETAYLSITRGESGVNLIGAERQAPLAVVRSAELLAERQRDGAHQYFTRAYDIGPTRVDSIVDASWPHDSLLKDVVSVIRAFRPQVVIALNSATDERDATRRLTARLAAEAFTAAADSVRLPAIATSRLPAWTVSRLLTRVDGAPGDSSRATVVDVGEFDRSAGRSYAEIGAEIRQLQRTQTTPDAPSIGGVRRWLRVDSSRVGSDGSLLGALDTTWARFHGHVPAPAEAQLDTLQAALAEVHASAANAPADTLAAGLARVAKRTSDVRLALPCGDVSGVPACAGTLGDLAVALNTVRDRATRAMLGAAGVVVDGVAARELLAAGDSVPVVATVYNGGGAPVAVRRLAVASGSGQTIVLRDTSIVVPADSAARWSTNVRVLSPTYHWWQIYGLVDGTFIHDFHTTSWSPVVPQLIEGEDRIPGGRVEATLSLGGMDVPVVTPSLVYRGKGVVRGDVRHPVAGVPATSVLLERTAEYERAALPIDRLFRVYLWSARATPDTLVVEVRLPAGLRADSATRTVVLPPFGARNAFFRLRGRLKPKSDSIFATARGVAPKRPALPQAMAQPMPAVSYRLGFVEHEYPRIPAQQFVRFSAERLEIVDVRVPPQLRVAYIKGTDDVQTPLGQLQIPVQTLDPSLFSIVDLSGFTTILVGADALANDAAAAAIPALNEFVRKGGTVVLMPGGEEIARSGLLPYPIAFDSVPRRVNDAAAEVHVTNVGAQVLNWPNKITAADFDQWVDGRARGVPVGFDQRYQTMLSMADPKQPPTTGTILVARVGKGTVVYSALSLDVQLAAVNAGAARLVVNLLAAGLRAGVAK